MRIWAQDDLTFYLQAELEGRALELEYITKQTASWVDFILDTVRAGVHLPNADARVAFEALEVAVGDIQIACEEAMHRIKNTQAVLGEIA